MGRVLLGVRGVCFDLLGSCSCGTMSDQQLAKLTADADRYKAELANCDNLTNTKDCAEQYGSFLSRCETLLGATGAFLYLPYGSLLLRNTHATFSAMSFMFGTACRTSLHCIWTTLSVSPFLFSPVTPGSWRT